MKDHRTMWIVGMLFLLIGIARPTISPADTQGDRWQGEFKLPFQVRWGNEVLPPGEYKFRLATGGYPQKVTLITVFGKAKSVGFIAYNAAQCHHENFALMVAQSGPRTVYSLHLGNQVYLYGTRQVEEQLIAAGVKDSGCCHMACCRETQQPGTHAHAQVLQSIPVSVSGK